MSRRSNSTSTGDGFGPTLNATELAKGQRTSGGMVFDTEPAARHGKIVMLDTPPTRASRSASSGPASTT
jgi:hypothetical protein